ncbi:MAG: ankyrin repeat domain-containing protein [Parachlamydiaceae bacterium]|nr:ankyrin repeat domain-containing protein [Parachlamydiaceae bacterium]
MIPSSDHTSKADDTRIDMFYVKKDDELWDDVVESLDAESERALTMCSKGDSADWVPGEGRTTGICAAYAFECVDHVNKHGDKSQIPPLIESEPTDKMKFLEMQLVRGIYQTLGKGETYQDVTFGEKNKDLINKSILGFAQLVRSNTGLKIVDQLPEESSSKKDLNFNKTTPITEIAPFVESLVQSENEHQILFLRNPDDHLSKGHVVYVNIKKGIIADGATGVMWKIPEHCKKMFGDSLKHYIATKYGDSYQEVSAIAIEKTFNLKSKLFPLSVRKVNTYSHILYDIGRTEGVRKALDTGVSFVAGNEFVKKSVVRAKKVWSFTKSASKFTSDITKSLFSSTVKQKAFVEACLEGKLKTAKLFVNMGGDVNEPSNGVYPLTAAAKSGNMELVKYLLKSGAKVNQKSFDKIKPGSDLFISAMVELEDISPLTLACRANNYEMVELLINKGATVKPIHLLSTCLNKSPIGVKIAELLLKKGVNPNDEIYVEGNRSPLEAAIFNRDEKLVKLLLDKGAKTQMGNSVLLSEVIYHWQQSKDSVSRDAEEAQTSYERIARQLLDAGADIEKLYAHDETPSKVRSKRLKAMKVLTKIETEQFDRIDKKYKEILGKVGNKE